MSRIDKNSYNPKTKAKKKKKTRKMGNSFE